MDTATDIHISLPSSLLTGLDRAARERRVTRVHLVRELISDFLRGLEKARVEQEMATYAEEMAPHSQDFVRETDQHTTQRLLRETEW